MKTSLAVLLMAGGAAVAGAQEPAAASRLSVDRIVAVVGSQPILWSKVAEQLNLMRAQGDTLPSDSAAQGRLARQILNRLVDEELLIQLAKRDSVEVPDADLNSGVEQQMKRVRDQFPSEDSLRVALQAAGFGSPEEYRRWLVDQQRRAAIQQRLFERLRAEGKIVPLPVSEKEVTDYFERNRSRLPRAPATVTFRQIVVAPKASPAAKAAALAKAESLRVEIEKGGDFEQVAKRESMDPGTKETGGDLGWRRRGQFVPEFERVAFALRPGRLSPVVETTFGYHLIRVDRVQPAEVKVRHILIRPAIDSADIAAARREAQSVAERWRAGASFDSLVTRHHDPSEEKTIPQPFPRSQLPEAYQAAFKGKAAKVITDPFEIQDKARNLPKFVVAQLTSVTEEHDPSVEEWRTQIRQQLAQERGMRRFLDNLRASTFVSVRL